MKHLRLGAHLQLFENKIVLLYLKNPISFVFNETKKLLVCDVSFKLM